MAEEQLGRSLEQLTASINEQNKELKQKDSLKDLDKSITALEKSGSENSAKLRETLTQVQLSLENASNEEQLEIAREQLEALKDTASTEEENREAAKRQEESNELLTQLVSGIDGLADAYDKQLDALKPSGGLLAGLGAAALLFMDPETLFAGVRAAIDGVFAIVDSIKMFLDGDFSDGLALLGENIGAVSAIIGTVAVLFGGRIIRLMSSMVKGVQGIVKAVTKVGGFVTRLAGRFGGLAKIFGRIFLPFTIITAAIGTINGIVDGFKEDGIIGGIEGGLTGLFNTLIGWPLDLLKGAVGWILGTFGFDKAESALASFSFQDLIDDMIGGVFDMIKGAFNWIGTLFTDPVAALQSLWDGLVSGANWLVDIVYAPINAAINWISGLFGWSDPNEPFKLQDTITNVISGAINWVKELFTNPVAALESLAIGLIGVDGILGVILDPIDRAIAWIQGLFNIGDPSRPFSLYNTIYTPIDAAINWLKGLFTDPVAAMQQAWNGLVGQGGLVDILLSPVDKAIAWIQGIFSWGNPEEPFELSTLVKNAFISAKDWIVGLFTWGSEAGTGEDGSWSLSTFIPNAFADVKQWFIDKMSFGANLATEGWTNLKDFVIGKFGEAKDWFIGKLTFGADLATEGWTNLTDFVKGKWTATKEWFTGMFSWSSDEEDKGVIQQLFDSAIEKVTTFFTDLFDFLPSFAEIKANLTSMLPEWMQPASIDEQRAELLDQLASMEAAAANALPAAEQFDNPLTNDTREDFEAEAAAIRAQLEALPQASEGGFINAPSSGGLAMLHGAEIVAPLDSPQGKVLMAINDLMNAKAASGAGEYGGMGGPMIVQGGSNSSSNNTNNVSTSTYTIQQGITPDDFLKRDFVNFSY